MGALVDAASARLGCLLRAQSVVTAATAPAPAATAARLTLYDFEASPWCRRVRECAQSLGLPLRIRPCPRQTVMAEGVFTTESAYRGAAGAAGGRVQFPLLVDESAGRTLYQSGDIVAHLWACYGPAGSEQAAAAAAAPPGILATALLTAPSAARPHRGVMRWSHWPPPRQPLEVWASEGCWRSVLVREALCELELEYILRPGLTPPRLYDPNSPSCSELGSTASGVAAVKAAGTVPDGPGRRQRQQQQQQQQQQQLEGHVAILSHLTAHYASGPRPGWRSLLASVPDGNLGAADAEAEVLAARVLQRAARTIDSWARGGRKSKKSGGASAS